MLLFFPSYTEDGPFLKNMLDGCSIFCRIILKKAKILEENQNADNSKQK